MNRLVDVDVIVAFAFNWKNHIKRITGQSAHMGARYIEVRLDLSRFDAALLIAFERIKNDLFIR